MTEVETSMIETGRPRSKLPCLIFLTVCLTFILACVSLYYTKDSQTILESPPTNKLDGDISIFNNTMPDRFIPKQFAISERFQTKTQSTKARTTSWIFAALSILEQQYKYQGITQGYLGETEYLPLSKQAYASLIYEYCHKNESIPVCKFGDLLQGQTQINTAESFLYFYDSFENFSKSVVPDSVCKYTETPSKDTDTKCDDLNKAVSNNSIQFTIKGTKNAFDIRGSKQLLFESNRPLLFTFPTHKINYILPCQGEEEEECKNKVRPCPWSFGSDYCYAKSFKGKTADGFHVVVPDDNQYVIDGSESFNLVGYNDDSQYNSRYSPQETFAAFQGSLIVKAFNGDQGHSLGYLQGETTIENEQSICPNHRHPDNWIPATLDCVKEHPTDLSKCSTDIIHVRGQNRTFGADLLKCINTGVCEDGYNYALSRTGSDATVENSQYGVQTTEFIKWKAGSDPTTIKVSAPFWALNTAFEPAKIVENDPDLCGHEAIPYSLFNALKKKNKDLFESIKATDIQIEFARSSFMRDPAAENFDLKYINESMTTVHKPEFDGPIPFNVIYQ